MKKINWLRTIPFLYTGICWTLLGFAVTKQDWRYLYALGATVFVFFLSPFITIQIRIK